MGDLGLPGSVVEVTDATLQKEIWEVRKAGLNIMMSMKGDGKPVSFIEDCAVPLEHLAEYTERLTQRVREARHTGHLVRARVGGHAARAPDAQHAPRRRGKNARHRRGSLCDGQAVQGRLFRRARRRAGALGMDRADPRRAADRRARRGQSAARSEGADESGQDRAARRAWTIARCSASSPATRSQPLETALDWTAWGGFAPAVEMCNNNGHCRKFDAGTMCPSFRVTGDEQHLTRGRANTLRLALSGQLGADALASDAMRDTMELCVSCKGCRRECPTGVDMARMKIEFQHQYAQAPRLVAAAETGRLPAPLCAAGCEAGAAAESARRDSRRGAGSRKNCSA